MGTSEDSDNLAYGYLLGEYFSVVSTIGAMEAQFDEADLEDNETYNRLLESRRELRSRLDESSKRHAESDLKSILDEAFSDLE